MRAKGSIAALAAVVLLIAAAPAAAQQTTALKIGWEQDPQTLSPFVDQDEEDFRVWAMNWDLLVNFSPKDLSPSPGIAQTWDIAPDKKSVTFHLVEGAKWSDGEPITSEDVKWSLDVLGKNGLLFTSYVENIGSIETPDESTVVVRMKKPDARIVGGLFVYILPKHIWGEQSLKSLTGTYKPTMPLVGSGPYIATEFDRGRIIRMERNPNFRGSKPKFDEVQWIKYGNGDAVERALKLGEIDVISEVQSSSFDRLGREKSIDAVKSPSPSFTQLAFNLCPRSQCPDAKYNPAVQDRVVRQAIAYAIDRERINKIGARDTAFPGHGLLPQYYKAFYTEPADDYPLDVAKANQLLDDAGYARGSDDIRAKGSTKLSFDLFVRSESQENTTDARLVAEMAKAIGVEFKVQVVSVDKLTELTVQKKDGKPAPDFDTFIWGWGGDPYDPGILLNLLTTNAIGGSSDAFYSNPEYDRLYAAQTGEFDQAKRKGIVGQMIALSQRDLPYIVLTVDPVLQAYRTDRVSGVKRSCPQPDGDILCDQVSYAPLLTLSPPTKAAAAADDDGGGGALYVLVGLVVAALVLGGVLVVRRQRSKESREALEV